MKIAAHADYRDTPADMEVYTMRGRCTNCRTEVVGTFTRGTRCDGPRLRLCPNCGCNGVVFT